MEPGSISAQRGTLADPEVLPERPGHVIPILEREFDDFETEADEVPRRRHAGGRVHQVPPQAGRLRPAPAGRQMIRVKLPFGGITRADGVLRRRGREVRAAEQGPHHDAPERADAPHPAAGHREGDPRARESGLSSREGCGNTVRNVTGDPWAGVAKDELFDMTPYVGAYVRYFVRHPTTQAMPRKIKTAFDGARERPRDQRHPRHRLPSARDRRTGGPRLRDARRRRHLDHAARRARAVRLRRRRRRRVPEDRRGGACGSSTARSGCASTAPARASRCSSTSIGIDELRDQVEEELEGRLGRRTRLRPGRAACS
jgi:hypothetical protein